MSSVKLYQRLVCACLLAMLAASCGKNEPTKLSEYVTPDTSVAAIVNLDEIYRQAGMPLVKQPMLDGMQSEILSMVTFSMMNSELEPLIPCQAIDTKEVLLIKTSGSDTPVKARPAEILGVRVIDEEAFEKEVNAEGYTAAVVRHGDFAFLSENKETIEKYLAEADGEAPAALITVKEALDGNGNIRAAIHAATDVAGKNTEWATSTITFKGETVSAEVKAFDTQGNPVKFGEIFEQLDPQALGFIPSDASIAGAFGKPTVDMKFLDSFFNQYLGIPASRISGTTAFAMGLAGSVDNLRSAGPEAFNIQLATQASPQEAERLVSLCTERYRGAKNIDGQNVARILDCDLYFGEFDGYFAQSFNRPVSSVYGNDLAPYFEGKRVAIAVNIPYGGALMKGLNLSTGLSLNIGLTEDQIKARLRFNGNSNPAVVTLLEMNQDLVQFLGAAPALLL